MTAPDSPLSARARVREDLRHLILSGEFKPGARLTQTALAKRFGVAQSVIRESLLELQLSGLVESVDNLGVFVADLDLNRLLQAYEVREVLEGLAARRATDHASRTDIATLTTLAHQIHQLGLDNNNPQRNALDRDFHHAIIRIAGNPILTKLTESYRMLGMIIQASRDHDAIRSEHLAIVDAIATNRQGDAEHHARAHVARARRSIHEQMTKSDFVPQWVLDNTPTL
jgi:DNA-binding GntR family transcriptional regulator